MTEHRARVWLALFLAIATAVLLTGVVFGDVILTLLAVVAAAAIVALAVGLDYQVD